LHILYSVFGLLDFWIVPETKHIAWFIRFVIVVPVVTSVIFISFKEIFKQYNQLILIVSSIVVGLGIVLMIAFSKPTELGYKYYYSGLILVIFWIYTFVRLRFWNSIFAGLIITLAYEFVAIFVQNLLNGDRDHLLVFINNNFFFISANILGIAASYHIEKLYRIDFVQKQTIFDENIRIVHYSNLLQQKNEQIVVQNIEIEAQRDELSRQNNLLEIQKYDILLKNNELRELNATKDKFFGIIAHDFKNPFTTIITSGELLLMQLSEYEISEIEHKIRIINRAARQNYDLLNNLLEWSESQTGRIKFSPKEIDLTEIIHECVMFVKAQAEIKEINIVYQFPEKLEIHADENLLKSVIRNLLTNAIKFTERNGLIEICSIEKHDFVQLSIKDSGVGIAAHILDKIFKIDNKVSTNGTAYETGTGLGLLLCKEFVEMHNGKIWVESLEGKGSTFSFSIPLNKSSIL